MVDELFLAAEKILTLGGWNGCFFTDEFPFDLFSARMASAKLRILSLVLCSTNITYLNYLISY